MKKIIALVLCIVPILSLSACSVDTSSLEDKITQLEVSISELEGKISQLERKSVELEGEFSQLESTINQDSTVEYETVILTKENYTQYLNINLEYSEYIVENINGTTEYHLACKGRITTSTNSKDYEFCDVKIFYNTQEVLAGWTSSISPTVILNRDGSSATSFSLYKKQDYLINLCFPSSQYYDVTINSIYGNVLVPKR